MSTVANGASAVAVRSVRFPVQPIVDESLAGLIVRTAAENVLGQPAPILRAAGYAMNSICTAPPDAERLMKLSAVIGADASEIQARLYPPIEPCEGPPLMSFFGARIRAAHRCSKARRLAPSALRHSDHHRALWEIRPITFCPETWDFLIEECLACGAELGWKRVEHIAMCPRCGADQRDREVRKITADRPLLAFAAGLVDPRPDVRSNARQQLPPPLRSVDDGTAFELVLALGELPKAVTGPQEPHERMARGAELVLGWPHAVDKLLDSAAAQRPHEASTTIVLRRFRQLVWERTTIRPVAELLRKTYTHRLSGNRSYPSRVKDLRRTKGLLTLREAARALKLSTSDVTRLRDEGLLKPHLIGGGKRTHGWFSPDELTAMGAVLSDRISATQLRVRHGLGQPAVEQLVRLGLLELHTHPAIRLLHPGLQLCTSSTEQLFRDLVTSLPIPGPEHAGWVPLAKVLRGFGGFEKPVGFILERLLTGQLQLTMDNDWRGFRYEKILAPPYFLAKLRESERAWRIRGGVPGDPREGHLDQADIYLTDRAAMELLNCHPREYHAGAERWLLGPRTGTQKRRVDRKKAAAFARACISSIEVGRCTGLSPQSVPKVMKQLDVKAFSTGFWLRGVFEERLRDNPGFLPSSQLQFLLWDHAGRGQ